MPNANGNTFQAEIPVTSTLGLAIFKEWLKKHGTLSPDGETIVSDNHVCKFVATKTVRQGGLQRSLRTAFKKQAVACDDVRIKYISDVIVAPQTTEVATTNVTDVINGYMIGEKTVRKTLDVPPKVSVYDLIDAVTEQPDAGRKTFFRLKNEYPNVGAFCPNYKFPGRGQRLTPVTNARGVVTIINLLPGRAAAVFRSASADVMVRFMGGDLSRQWICCWPKKKCQLELLQMQQAATT